METKESIKKNYEKDFADYILDYISEVETLGAIFIGAELGANDGDIEHHIFQFSISENFIENKEILNRDDDSQPHNSYRIYFGDLFIYETRYT